MRESHTNFQRTCRFAVVETQTMVNVRDKKCQCGKAQPYFNEPGQTVAICCSKLW